MALLARRGDPARMPSSIESRNHRPSPRRFAMPAAVVGGALLGLSLLLSVGPALGAANHSNNNDANGNGNGTSGTLKVHDARTGLETSGNGNEPHVCDFWLEFTSDTSEVGTWIVVSWAPTGDGSTVASGAYDTSGDGVDSSNIIELPAGHYRAEWAATGESVTSKKTFWVDADCDEAVTPVDPPPEEPASSADESGAEDAAPPGDESPMEESVLAGAGSPADDPGTQSDESPTDNSPAEEPAAQSGESAPSPVDPSDEEEPAQAADPGTTDSPAPPVQDQLGGTGTSPEPTMSDTATRTLPVPTGAVATFGLLLLILAHATMRGGKLSISARS
jgi:hypothetical protein